MYKMSQKLKNMKHKLKDWARTSLGNTQQKLIQNAQKIELVKEKLSNQLENHHLNSWMTRLLRQREKLFNQKYWGNLRRNSRYFQQKASTWRKKKLVWKLKGDCGIWLDSQRDLAEKFVSDFSGQFKSNHVSNRPLSELSLNPCITHSDNIKLIRIPNVK